MTRAGPPDARLDGASDVLWEPTWRLGIRLAPHERALLRTPALRRLHFVAHAGAAALATPHVHSRLQHVAGVFALVAHLAPEEPATRAAALLHDVGHAPFSHSLEGVPGVDHHRWTAEIVRREPVAGILRGSGLEPDEVLALAEGEVASVLKNRDGVLHLDHLDSFVRGAVVRGTLPTAAPILEGLRREGPYATFDRGGGAFLEDAILEEARLHVAPHDLGASARLSALTARLVEAGALDVDELPGLTDAVLAARLLSHPPTRPDALALWHEPGAACVQRLAPGEAPPPGARVVEKRRLYLDLPRVRGRAPAEEAARRAELERRGADLLGRYAVAT